MNTLLIKNIDAVVTCDGADRILENASVYAEDGVIRSIGDVAPDADIVIDGRGMLCYPGLVNTHLCETLDEERFTMETVGMRPLRYMETLGWLGSIEVGKCADMFLIRKNRLELVGASFDPGAALATVGLKAPVDYTVVNGRITVENGRLTGVDEEKLIYDAEAEIKRYLSNI